MEVNGAPELLCFPHLQNIFLCVQQNKDIPYRFGNYYYHFWVNYPFKSYISKRDFSWLNNTQITCSSFDRSSTPSLSNLQEKNNATSVNDLQQRVVFYSRSDDRFRHQPQRTAVVTVECGCGDSRAVPGVVIGDEFLVGGYSGPGLLVGVPMKDAGGYKYHSDTHGDNCQI